MFLEIKTDSCKGTDTEVNYLEHVQAVISANATRRGDLELFLTSPMGTRWAIVTSEWLGPKKKNCYNFYYVFIIK